MEKIKKNKLLIISFIITAILVIIDQITKGIIIETMSNKIIIKNILKVICVQNTGGAFGVAQNSTAMFIITNIIVLGIILRFIYIQKDRINNQTLIMLLLVLAGGISNLIDRIFRGFVVDFINVFPTMNFPKFNLADMYITIGYIGLAFLFALYTWKEVKNKTMQEE